MAWISYEDSEVNCFHPVCQEALEKALKLIGKENEYQVLHHQYTASLEMDFTVQNIKTGKYLCVVEVKKTPQAIYSARYQYQALSYVEMNADRSEKPFYILTNLESAIAFRYDLTRPRVVQQMLQPGAEHIGNFGEDDKEDFISKLSKYFSNKLSLFLEGSYEYCVALDEFEEHMKSIKGDSKKWKTHLAALLYEYIRGAFVSINRHDLHDIRAFGNNVARICAEATRVNFKDIFNYSSETFEKSINIDEKTLEDLFDFGNKNVSGDAVADVLHSIVSAGHEHEGEVPTDTELAVLVAELARFNSGDLNESECVCDPAAGSGNLISAAIKVYNLLPTQVIANDVNSKLLELLSLRLGLNYPEIINKNNSPSIYNNNLANISPDFFKDVKTVVVNPPFVAGIYCKNRKPELYKAIESITGRKAKTETGQMPLEAVFLELLVNLVKPGTTISCVFPKTHLMGRGEDSIVIRKLLLDQFGLNLVFTYPRNELFDQVTKETCVLVGNAQTRPDTIKVVSSYTNVPDIDFHNFSKIKHATATETFRSVAPGLVMAQITRKELEDSLKNGWRMLNSEMTDAIVFVENHFQKDKTFIELSQTNCTIKRGSAGNTGGSDLLFFKSNDELYDQFEGREPALSIGVKNAKSESIEIGLEDKQFLDISSNNDNMIHDIIVTYNELPLREGKQQRKKKTDAELLNILSAESKRKFPANSVLVPRAIRTTGRIYISKNSLFVSTNFVVCTFPNFEEALLVATWMSTIFYQLICEASSKDQEGMRKMEVSDIESTYIPDINKISKETIDNLKQIYKGIDFLNLQAPQVREVDRVWADALFGTKADTMLEEASRELEYLSNRRNPI